MMLPKEQAQTLVSSYHFSVVKVHFHCLPYFFPAAERADSNTHNEGCQGLKTRNADAHRSHRQGQTYKLSEECSGFWGPLASELFSLSL